MESIVCWWSIVEILGLVGWVAGWRAFARFPDRGFVWSKPLGTLLVGGTLWLLAALGVLRNDLGGAWIATLLVAGLAGFAAWPPHAAAAILAKTGWRAELSARWRRRGRLIVLEEAVFLLAFLAWSIVRAANPAVEHTEQPMDLMFLNAVSVSSTVPPADPWLAGNAVSYYYFGYWLLGTVGRLAGQVPEVSYNLGQAAWWGFLISGTFGLGFHLTRLQLGRRASRRGLAGGALAAVGVAVAGNLHLAVEFLRSGIEKLGGRGAGGPADLWGDWWWWRASRVVSDVDLSGRPIEIITEFPLFSYLLGDDHPHLLSMPFLALVAALALAAARAPTGGESRARSGPAWLSGQNLPALGLGSIAVAALVPMNTWDFPAAAALLVGSALLARGQLSAPHTGPIAFVLTGSCALALSTAILTLPYLLTAQSQVQGIRPNFLHPTSPAAMAIMFGAFLPGLILTLLAGREEKTRVHLGPLAGIAGGLLAGALAIVVGGSFWSHRSPGGQAWIAGLGGSHGVWVAALDRWRHSGGALVGVLVLLAAAFSQLMPFGPRSSPEISAGQRAAISRRSLMLMLALGLGLVAAAELVYVQDLFGTRMNTVFKLWYQAWFFFGVVSAVGLAAARRRSWFVRVLRGAGVSLLALGLLYTARALHSKTARPQWTWNGLAHLEELAPEMRRAGLWLRSNTPADARILEAPGDSYHAEHNLLSAMTGRATLLGWQGHEQQWRGSAYARVAESRMMAADRIYGAVDREQLDALLEQWQIEYVVYGPREHEVYGTRYPGARERLQALMAPVFDSESVTILRRRR